MRTSRLTRSVLVVAFSCLSFLPSRATPSFFVLNRALSFFSRILSPLLLPWTTLCFVLVTSLRLRFVAFSCRLSFAFPSLFVPYYTPLNDPFLSPSPSLWHPFSSSYTCIFRSRTRTLSFSSTFLSLSFFRFFHVPPPSLSIPSQAYSLI